MKMTLCYEGRTSPERVALGEPSFVITSKNITFVKMQAAGRMQSYSHVVTTETLYFACDF